MRMMRGTCQYAYKSSADDFKRRARLRLPKPLMALCGPDPGSRRVTPRDLGFVLPSRGFCFSSVQQYAHVVGRYGLTESLKCADLPWRSSLHICRIEVALPRRAVTVGEAGYSALDTDATAAAGRQVTRDRRKTHPLICTLIGPFAHNVTMGVICRSSRAQDTALFLSPEQLGCSSSFGERIALHCSEYRDHSSLQVHTLLSPRTHAAMLDLERPMPVPLDQSASKDSACSSRSFDDDITLTLPRYSNELHGVAHFLLKPELREPHCPWPRHRWRKVVLSLEGTQIFLRQASGFLICVTPLSLQAAETGLATDCVKRPNVFRLRVEGFQFLLAAADAMSALNRIDRLSAAANVSLDLDERGLPRDNGMFTATMPRRSQTSSAISGLMRRWRDSSLGHDQAWLRRENRSSGCLSDPRDSAYAKSLLRMRQRHEPHADRHGHCICSTCYSTPSSSLPQSLAHSRLAEMPSDTVTTQESIPPTLPRNIDIAPANASNL